MNSIQTTANNFVSRNSEFDEDVWPVQTEVGQKVQEQIAGSQEEAWTWLMEVIATSPTTKKNQPLWGFLFFFKTRANNFLASQPKFRARSQTSKWAWDNFTRSVQMRRSRSWSPCRRRASKTYADATGMSVQSWRSRKTQMVGVEGFTYIYNEFNKTSLTAEAESRVAAPVRDYAPVPLVMETRLYSRRETTEPGNFLLCSAKQNLRKA